MAFLFRSKTFQRFVCAWAVGFFVGLGFQTLALHRFWGEVYSSLKTVPKKSDEPRKKMVHLFC